MRSRALAFGCLIIGGALAMIGTSQPWWRAAGEGVVVRFSGTEATGGLSQALAIVALAGTLLMLALRTCGRRVIGGLLLLVGVTIAAVGGFRRQPNADTVRTEVREVSLADAFHVDATAWPWVFAVSGVLVAVGAALTMITGGTWPSGSNRFQAGPSNAEASASDDPAELWKAMDAGLDPTADASVGNRAPPHGGGAGGGVFPLRATTTAADSRCSRRRSAGGDGGTTPFRSVRSGEDSGNPANIAASGASNQIERDARAAGNKVDHNTANVPDPNVHKRAASDTMEDTGRQERGA
jgi:uncharacterized membrane protein (TIGR02234 family)